MEIKKATRTGIKPLIGLYSESGCGKTYSSLLLARGLVGPAGRVVMIDTESGRGSLYADVIRGGYDVLELLAPFSPSRYVEAITAAEKGGADVIVIDSASHEWEGIGGVLDMAGDVEQKSGRPGLHCWKTPKLEHAKFMAKMLQSTCPVIVCVRAKHKSHQVKGTLEMVSLGLISRNQVDKTVIMKDESTSPIQSEEFIFEMTAHMEIMQDHSIRLTKCSHPNLRDCFPAKGPINYEHGERLAAWCKEGKAPAPKTEPANEQIVDLKALKRQLWDMTKAIHGGDEAKLSQWLWDEGYMHDGQALKELSAEQINAMLPELQERMSA